MASIERSDDETGPVVLVVDDAASVRSLVRETLEPEGYTVIEAEDGRKALIRAAASPPDVVLLDLQMPGLDGFDVLAEVGGDGDRSGVPIIVISGDDTEHMVRSLAGGAHDFISKPFDPLRLLAKVEAACRVKRQHDALRAASTTDLLTKVLNRRGLEEQLDRVEAHSVRSGEVFTVAVVDIDRFKAINDELGHAVGDTALVNVAAALRDSVRLGDVIGRWGGEEFVVLLPATTAEDAQEVAERLWSRARCLVGESTARLLTVSIGVADGQRWREVFSRADDALYAAKAAGRDTIHIHRRTDGTAAPGIDDPRS
jgi:two-component system cell cycle response regulator